MPNTTTERNWEIVAYCNMCGKSVTLKVNFDDFEEYYSPNRRHIQDIFPYLTPAERELLISHTCEECWNKMFSFEEQ